MAFSAQELIASEYLTNTAGAVTTAETALKMKITKFLVTEQAGAGNSITVWLVPSGGSRGNDNRVINTQAITSNSTTSLDDLVGKIIPVGSVLHAQAGSGTTDVSIVIDATKYSDPA